MVNLFIMHMHKHVDRHADRAVCAEGEDRSTACCGGTDGAGKRLDGAEGRRGKRASMRQCNV